MHTSESLENFDYDSFMSREFPKPEGKYPDVDRLIKHFDKITALLMDCAIQAIKNPSKNNISAMHENTRYTIACNFRLRSINLIKIFKEVLDIDGNAVFDEGTANIIARSLLESYLVYYRLYNGCSEDITLQNLYFNLYDLSSVLQFVKYGKSIQGSESIPFKDIEFRSQIKKLILAIKKNDRFRSLPPNVRESIENISSNRKDFLSFINFSKLIKESPLPTEFFTSYYSYSSAFAHSEGFSSRVLQMIFQSRERWTEMNEMLKFKLIYNCLGISSQFFISFIEYDHTELEDEKEKEVWEVVSLSNYYLNAMAISK